MTDTPEAAAPDDDWMPDMKPAAVVPAKGRPLKAGPKVQPLRPLDELARQLDAPPVVAGGNPPRPPPPGDVGAASTPADDTPADDTPAAEVEGRKVLRDRPRGEIWKACPVKPLGVNGGTYYYLDVHGQLRPVTKHDAQNIMMLFGHMIPKLCYNFPKMLKDADSGSSYRKPDHFEHQPATVAMIRACSEKGLFDPENAVRGVGAWTDDDGHLVYHIGDRLIINGVESDPDTHHGRIYPAFPPIPHPAVAGKEADPVPALMETLSTWQWHRPEIDPMIMMGQIGVQAFGGALDWRPAYWITGGAGSGKSALQRLMLHLHGGEKGLVQSTDATARGIASLLGQSTLPVALDELEPGDQGSTKERDIVQTARVAASGGRWARGSSDQKGSTGQLRSTFLFSSILVPGVLKSQDLQRIILLSLNPFAEGAKAPDLRAETWRRRGSALKRLIIDRWPTWRERLDLWREAFAAHGVQGRDADNWATTICMAQMMQSQALPTADELAGWSAKVARAVKATLGDAGTDADEVLTHLLSQLYRIEGGREEYTIAQWLMVAAGLAAAPESLLGTFASDEDGREKRQALANAKLSKALIKIIADRGAEPRLFVGNAKAQTLLNLFAGTQWAGGAWKQSLERIKGAQPGASRTLAGIATRGVEIPLSAIPGLAAFPQDRDRAAPVPVATSWPEGMEDY